MSEKLKGDTSRPTATTASILPVAPSFPTTAAVVKNPLLSASVTGLTFDDFPNKPLLLPPVAINREPKPLVTIGSPTDTDTENLDEINLNTSNDETQSRTDSAANTGHIDPNANPLWSESNNQPTDSILTQAASSFSALPSVASSVLSTFSKRISEYSGSNSRERTPISDNNENDNIASQLDIQPAYLQQQFQTQQQQYPYYNNPQANAPAPIAFAHPAGNSPFATSESITSLPPEPPKLYTPTEVPILPAASAAPPPLAGGQNTYRLAAKKKLYAPIPGLSEQTAGVPAPTIDPLISAAPVQGIPPLPSQSTSLTDPFGYPTAPAAPQLDTYESSYQAAHFPGKEERKTGGLFSNISNLVPSGVLQNISGLVQSATGTFTQGSNKIFPEDTTQQSHRSFTGVYQHPPSEAASANTGQYIGASGLAPAAVPPPAAQFYPASIEPNLSSAAFFAPPQLPPPQQSVAQVQVPTAQQTSHLFTQPPPLPPVGQPLPPPPTTGFVAGPPKSATADSTKQRPSASTTPISYFDPTKQPSKPVATFGVSEQSTNNSAPTQAPSTLLTSASASSHNNYSFAPPIATGVLSGTVPVFESTQASSDQVRSPPLVEIPDQPKQLASAEVITQQRPTGVPLFDQRTSGPSNPAQLPSTPGTVTFPPPQSIFPPPTAQQPVSSNQTPLPSTGGSTSFRLQKGTRLYKSPLTPAETAPVQVQADIVQPFVPPTSFFNPFGSPAPTSAPNPLAPLPAAPTLVPSYFIAQPAESSVGLFAVDKPIADEKSTTDTVRDPQLLTVSDIAGQEPDTNFVGQSLPGEDLGAIIQQQTIEAVVPEVATDLESEVKSASLDTWAETTKPSEVLNVALEQLSLTAQPQESTIQQDLFSSPKEQEKEDALIPKFDEPQLFSTPIPPPKFEQQHLKPQESQSETISAAESALNVQVPSLQEAQPSTLVVPSSQAETNNQPIINPLLPPSVPQAHRSPEQGQNANPFRKNVVAAPFVAQPQLQPTPSSETQPKLANFFADALGIAGPGGAEFNIFTPPQQPLLSNNTEPLSSTIPAEVPSEVPNSAVAAALPSAAGFFSYTEQTPSSFFQPVQTQETKEFPSLPPLSSIAPPPLTHEAPTTAEVTAQPPLGIPPPLGFDNILLPQTTSEATQSETETLTAAPQLSFNTTGTTAAFAPGIQTSPCTTSNTQPQHSDVINSFSNYFKQTSNHTTESKQLLKGQQQTQIAPSDVSLLSTTTSSPAHFFDTLQPTCPSETEINSLSTPQQQQQQTVTQPNEDQRLQNFFNNPPQRENNAGVGDLGYDLVHSGLAVRNLGSFTSVSNLVEPPSSSCSEFSEWNNSNVNSRTLPAELLTKRSPEKSLTVVEQQQEVQIATAPQQEQEVATESQLGEQVASEQTEVENPVYKHYGDLPEEILRELRMANMLIGEKAAASAPPTTVPYSPALKHWFYKRPSGNNKFVWTPFSHYDSGLLESTFFMSDNAPNIVAVEGGRYDVNIKERTKTSVYWECTPIEVRRCSWFYKGTDSKMVPYEEPIADLLENEYKQAVESGEWHKKIVLSMNEQVTFHGPTVIVHFQQQQSSDAWGGTSQTTTRPRVVKRDLEEFTIEQGESERVDHLLLMVHGIGAACDLKMRSVDEVVDDFRNIAQALVQSHYKNSTDMGLVGRVEVLPISWHSHLHSEEMGIDEKLRSITLESIPKLRNFTNNTLLDVLFYTSPKYCQKIMNTVAASMNEVYNKYRERHPEFSGGVSVAGHSLGSLILFDLLCHQKAPKETEEQNLENPDQHGTSPMETNNDDLSVTTYTMGHAGTGQPFIHYTQLNFQPKKFFALGSPIGMFVTIRGIDKLGLDFRLPTCAGFYNIFHPFDPVAYRIEALVNPDLSGVRPVLIPHHKGRKRMHLELKETMTRVGADLKQRFLDTFKNTLDSVNFLGGSIRNRREAEENMTKEVDKVLSMQIEAEKQSQQQQTTQSSLPDDQQAGSSQVNTETPRTRSDSVSTDSDLVEIDFPLGKLNDSKRIDYVLQEAPLEFINEYIFALGAHVCYWESEDTILFVMKEIYTGLGISPDSQVPQQTMTIERPSSRNSNTLSPINEKR
ncbi:mucin-2 isoform X1 [Anastrepha obliqua]|uniref:mucin-2 isoform X1 n=1 Tax=Anastrepha obliqua TaxID=95512 RepID=UPI002409B33A|nr:mucin-2 isoform X1 [Anastrepha obliqua]